MVVNTILLGNNLETLKTIPDQSVNCCVTSPPYYGLRDYGIDNQIGLEETPQEYIEKLVDIFREVKRVLRNDGTLWLNIGDSYAGSGKGGSPNKEKSKQAINKGSLTIGNLYEDDGKIIERRKKINVTSKTFEGIKAKDLIGIPWMLAFALRADGWYLRQDIIWSKPSVMPESVKDRFCKSHEHIFLLSKEQRYYFDHKYALEPATGYDGRKDTVMKGSAKYADGATGLTQQTFLSRGHERWTEDDNGNYMRTRRDVWVVASDPSELAHFAMYPQKLILPCVMCGCPENGVVLDPFMGSGTTGLVAIKNFRKYIGCEINPEYKEIAEKRISNERGLFNE